MDSGSRFAIRSWRDLAVFIVAVFVGVLIFALAARCESLSDSKRASAPVTQIAPASGNPTSGEAFTVHRRTIDRDFLLVEAAKAAAYSWDGATTIHAQNLGCTEQNPFIGARPAPHKVAAFLGAEFAASTLLDYLIKRSVQHKRGWRAWRIVPLTFGAVHGIAGAVTVSNGCF